MGTCGLRPGQMRPTSHPTSNILIRMLDEIKFCIWVASWKNKKMDKKEKRKGIIYKYYSRTDIEDRNSSEKSSGWMWGIMSSKYFWKNMSLSKKKTLENYKVMQHTWKRIKCWMRFDSNASNMKFVLGEWKNVGWKVWVQTSSNIIQHDFFLLFSNANASNIGNVACWMKCWMHSRGFKFYENWKKEEKKSCWMKFELGQFSFNIHPTFKLKSGLKTISPKIFGW